MTTPVYTFLDYGNPVISNNKITTENYARNNLTNIRDNIALLGYMPGWDMSLVPNSGSNYNEPASYIFTRGIEAIKIDITWVSIDLTLNGSGNNYPSKAYFYYSTDSKNTWQPLKDRNGKYVVTCTYNAGDDCTAEVWGTS